MDLIRVLLITSIATIIPGQVIRIPIVSSGAITLTDISVAITVITFLFLILISKKPLYFPKKIFYMFLLFCLSAFASTLLALNNFTPNQILESSLFLIRFILYFLIVVVSINVIKKNKITQWLNAVLFVGLIFTLIGILQIILIPDLSFLTIWGWDPHRSRLTSSLIDPNFSGLLISTFLTIALVLYLHKKTKLYLLETVIFFSSIILTFSRSSYLALMTAIIIIGLMKSSKIIVITILLFVVIIFASEKVQERISGAFNLDETTQARFESWQNALAIFRQNLIFGVGFNTYRFAQNKYGNFSLDNPIGGHSGSGSDSSFALVAATTGILGLSAFLLFLISIVKLITKNVAHNHLRLMATAAFFSLLIHSQFVNSFFYPQIMVVIWLLIGLSYVKENLST